MRCATLWHRIYDDYNVSNFIFIPVEWARNLFQSWTRDVTCSASDNQLSRPSKTTSGRKKVLILLVNKPDWFEPGELTYLGFDNDASEFPVAESDKIDFSINYSDTSKKFLNGDTYNGTIAGPKKIIRCTRSAGNDLAYQSNGYYETGSGTYRLKFPHKGTVRLTVAPSERVSGSGGSGKVTFYNDNIGDTYDVRKDSTSGTSISLDSAQPFSGTQTFVFVGGSMPTQGASISKNINTTRGANFDHNLSVKKVRYSLFNATIANCILKKQILRDYVGCGYNGYDSSKSYVLTDGTVVGSYTPVGTVSVVYVGDSNDIKISKFRDSCIKSVGNYGYCESGYYDLSSNKIIVDVYGIQPPFTLSYNISYYSSDYMQYYTTNGWGNVSNTSGGTDL